MARTPRPPAPPQTAAAEPQRGRPAIRRLDLDDAQVFSRFVTHLGRVAPPETRASAKPPGIKPKGRRP
jgi:hypothetical protein